MVCLREIAVNSSDDAKGIFYAGDVSNKFRKANDPPAAASQRTSWAVNEA